MYSVNLPSAGVNLCSAMYETAPFAGAAEELGQFGLVKLCNVPGETYNILAEKDLCSRSYKALWPK